ncbi:hypothetical protein [Thiospirillum jenense]|uniref:Uncharacterized protein n=1 Tax=Thiospirillum jenense TaxID=1653858 RepID=A0A839HHU7_9GAMM|nr:hypothetical protein [Thiospirillum jenense]MBB1126568.1 hypothetical protein [Thiospirillum jenense]
MIPIIILAARAIVPIAKNAVEDYFEYDIEEGINQLQETLDQHTVMLSAIQSSLTAIGTAATMGCALSAVSVFQLLLIQKSLKRIEKKLDTGFLDLKVFVQEKIDNLLDQQQQQRLSEGFHYYLQGVEEMKSAILMTNPDNKRLALNESISMFRKALAIYDSRQDYNNTNLPARLRRMECAWAIEAMIAEVYSLQQEYSASINSYKKLKNRITAEVCFMEDKISEADFQFILSDFCHIYENDFVIIDRKIALMDAMTHAQDIQHLLELLEAENTPNTETDESVLKDKAMLFQNMPVPAGRYYLQCLSSDSEKEKHITSVINHSKIYLFDLKTSNVTDHWHLSQICEVKTQLDNKIIIAEVKDKKTSKAKNSASSSSDSLNNFNAPITLNGRHYLSIQHYYQNLKERLVKFKGDQQFIESIVLICLFMDCSGKSCLLTAEGFTQSSLLSEFNQKSETKLFQEYASRFQFDVAIAHQKINEKLEMLKKYDIDLLLETCCALTAECDCLDFERMTTAASMFYNLRFNTAKPFDFNLDPRRLVYLKIPDYMYRFLAARMTSLNNAYAWVYTQQKNNRIVQ